jgi:hypothetical protein
MIDLDRVLGGWLDGMEQWNIPIAIMEEANCHVAALRRY